jgi:UDP-glucose 4-epimerase
MNILITGTSGYVGDQLAQRLVKLKDSHGIGEVVGIDIVKPEHPADEVVYYDMDIRDEKISTILKNHNIDVVLHLACILSPSARIDKDQMYSINVLGTRNIIKACVENNVKRISFASSGAAYGYHPESVNWLTEDRPLRGNDEFPYSAHKRINEEDFLKLKETHPGIEQFIFRIGTVLGKSVDNLITDFFNKKVILGVAGHETPFVFIWDEDLVEIFIKSIFSDRPGAYNVAGDGAVTTRQIAGYLNKKFLPLPGVVLEKALGFANKFKLSQYGPEQVKFLKYRPVLKNDRLKNEFGYVPQKKSQEVFEYYLDHQ